jgi:hypothetical protein
LLGYDPKVNLTEWLETSAELIRKEIEAGGV